MSWLNDDVICIPCSEEEKNEPDYKLAKEKELEQRMIQEKNDLDRKKIEQILK